jgi:hypothetical protein
LVDLAVQRAEVTEPCAVALGVEFVVSHLLECSDEFGKRLADRIEVDCFEVMFSAVLVQRDPGSACPGRRPLRDARSAALPRVERMGSR